MGAFAVGLEIAQRIISDGVIPGFVRNRYASFDSGDDAKFGKGELPLMQAVQFAKIQNANVDRSCTFLTLLK